MSTESESEVTFKSLGLAGWIIKQTEKLGLKTPTPIQHKCIPEILAGGDCIGAAKTGSGKTFAFALPILQKLSEDPMSHFALVLTPTHELAYQISEQFLVAGQPMGVRVCVVAGGTDQMIESQKLQNRPHIVVAMPGRLADHLTGCDTFSFDNLKYLVIDEADRMLNGSFDESLEVIAACLPKQRQNLLFSATINDSSKNSQIFPVCPTAFEWSQQSEIATVSTLDQRYVLCAEYDRDQVLIETLRQYREDNEKANVIIFTNTKKCCEVLSMTLNSVGFENVCLHGFMRQKERVASLNKFKSNHIRTIIATDVASRGLDIPNVSLVINHRLPKLSKEYIHRVGRTARAGRSGMAISIFRFPRDLVFLAEIEAVINTKLTEQPIDQRLVERIFMQVSMSKREANMSVDITDFDEKMDKYRRKKWIEDGLDPDEMDNQWRKTQKDKIKKRKKSAIQARQKTNNNEVALTDDRFKNVKKENLSTMKFKRSKDSNLKNINVIGKSKGSQKKSMLLTKNIHKNNKKKT